MRLSWGKGRWRADVTSLKQASFLTLQRNLGTSSTPCPAPWGGCHRRERRVLLGPPVPNKYPVATYLRPEIDLF